MLAAQSCTRPTQARQVNCRVRAFQGVRAFGSILGDLFNFGDNCDGKFCDRPCY